MDRIVSRAIAGVWMFAAIALSTGAARAAVVVPVLPDLDVQSVADRVHSLGVAVRAHAFVTTGADGKNARIAEAVSSATGVLIGDGLVLTTLSAVAVRRSDGQLEPPGAIEVVTDQVGLVPARFVAGDPALDLAVLQLPDQLRELEGATLPPSDPAVGEEMIAIGAEGNSLYVVGVTLERVEFAPGGGARLYMNRDLPPSFWGGPLFDAEGRLAGLSTRPTSDSGFAIPASLLRTLIDRVHGATRI